MRYPICLCLQLFRLHEPIAETGIWPSHHLRQKSVAEVADLSKEWASKP